MGKKVTLRSILENSEFSGITCICCEDRLDNVVSGIQIMDNPDTIKWHKPGDLVLTTGFLLREDMHFRRTLMLQLAGRKCAGLIFKVHRFFDKTPEDLVESARKYGIPILELPGDYAISDVDQQIMRRIYSSENESISRLHEMYRTLTLLITQGKPLQDILDELYVLLHNPLVYLSKQGQPQFLSRMTAGHPPLLKTFFTENALPLETGALEKLEQAFTAEQSHNLSTHISFLNQRRPCILWPAALQNNIYGYLCLIHFHNTIEPADITALEAVLPILTLELLRQNTMALSRSHASETLLDLLLSDHRHNIPELRTLCSLHGFRTDLRRICLYFSPLADKSDAGIKLVSQYCRDYLQMQEIDAYVQTRGSNLICLLAVSPAENPAFAISRAQETAEQLIEHLATVHQIHPLTCGIGNVCTLENLLHGYEQAREALRLGMALPGLNSAVNVYHKQAMYHTLLTYYDEASLRALYQDTVAPLVSYDEKHNTALFPCFEALFAANGSLKLAAERLYIHRNTMQYRRQKICEILCYSLDTPQDYHYLCLGIYAKHLLDAFYTPQNLP